MATWRERYPLEKRKPIKKTIKKSLSYLLLVLLIGSFLIPLVLPVLVLGLDFPSFISSFIYIFLGILFGIFFLLFILRYIYEVYYMKYYFYDLVGKTLIIKKGVFSRNEISLPINRLQDVYVDQDVLDRMFGLYDVHVSSATEISGSLSHIDGLNKQNSEAIKKLLLSGIHKQNG